MDVDMTIDFQDSALRRPPAQRSPASLADAFARDLLAGLQSEPRSVSPKYFYDLQGSVLFDRICELDEYYPTRTEMALLSRHGREMAECVGARADLIEFGAGSLTKVRLLLDALDAQRSSPQRLIAVDISAEHLHDGAARLARDHPGLVVTPLAADFTQGLVWPASDGAQPGRPDAAAPAGRPEFGAPAGRPELGAPAGRPEFGAPAGRRVGFFPGSSIGNFSPDEALQFLRMAARLLRGGGLLVGVDLVKDPALLHRAYNDAQGVTAAFNKNLLARANRELGADFRLDGFDHYAFYEPRLQRVEMHLVSNRAQRVRLQGHTVAFEPGQTLHTENSHKYTVAGFRALALQAGFDPGPVWCDAQGLFSVHWLEAR
jgi:L-histidine Nalpha-methyltransferase